jgi:hypothetical protein
MTRGYPRARSATLTTSSVCGSSSTRTIGSDVTEFMSS